jgi:hypothetical protein
MDDRSTSRIFWIREHHIKRSHMVAKMEQKKADNNGSGTRPEETSLDE